MLKEQLLSLAIKALSRAHTTKEILKKNIQKDVVQAYVKNLKEMATWIIENRLQADRSSINKSSVATKTKDKTASSISKKVRKSSIRSAKEIASKDADAILAMIKKDKVRVIKKNDELNGKKSLAYLVWALGHAERAEIKEGISVHDVSSLLYRAGKIELYPINISRVVHSHVDLVRQVNQDKRTKTYLLTELGEKVFKDKFMK